jgi:hypothetical protein
MIPARRLGADEEDIEPIRVALTSAQIRQFQLAPVMTAKEDDTNYDGFVERAIDRVIDVAAFNAELEREKQDSVWLNSVRRTVHEALRSISLESE